MWTKSQKISGAVLGMAVAAFCVDRFVLAPPPGDAADAARAAEALVVQSRPASAALAAGGAALSIPASPARAGGPGGAGAAASAVTLASRLSAMAESRAMLRGPAGDAFRPADAWVNAWRPKPAAPAPGAKARAKPGAPAVAKVDPASAFRRKHTLTAVMAKRDSGGMAIVDGKLYATGQVIDGFTLTRIGPADATFAGRGGARVTLRVPGQQPAVADAR